MTSRDSSAYMRMGTKTGSNTDSLTLRVLWPWRSSEAYTMPCCFSNSVLLFQPFPTELNVLLSISRKQHTEVLELFDLRRQCIAACSVHWFGILARHNTSAVSVLSSFQIHCTLPQTRSNAWWMPYEANTSSPRSSAKGKRLILQLLTMTPSSARLRLSIQFMCSRGWIGVARIYTLVGVQHEWATVLTSCWWHGHKLLSRNAMTWWPVAGGHQHHTHAKPPKLIRETWTFAFLRSTKQA